MDRGVVAFFIAATVAFVLGVVVSWVNPEKAVLLPPRVAGLLFTLLLFTAMFVQKFARTRLWTLFVEVVNICLVIGVTHDIFLARDWLKALPYVGLKFLAFALALAAPPVEIPTVLAFFVIVIAPVIQVFFWWTPVQRIAAGVEEPWITIAFVICSLLLWYYRRHSIELARHEAELAAQNVLFRRLARLMLGAQHLINSPLQTIVANVHLIKLDCPQVNGRVKAIERALSTVHRITSLISFGDQRLRCEENELPNDLEQLTRAAQELSDRMERADGFSIR